MNKSKSLACLLLIGSAMQLGAADYWVRFSDATHLEDATFYSDSGFQNEVSVDISQLTLADNLYIDGVAVENSGTLSTLYLGSNLTVGNLNFIIDEPSATQQVIFRTTPGVSDAVLTVNNVSSDLRLAFVGLMSVVVNDSVSLYQDSTYSSSFGHPDYDPLNSLTINGGLDNGKMSFLVVFSKDSVRRDADYDASYFASADTSISGLLNLSESLTYYTAVRTTNMYAKNVYARVGAISGASTLAVNARNAYVASSGGAVSRGFAATLNLMITGTSATEGVSGGVSTLSGNIDTTDTISAQYTQYTNDLSDLRIVMNSADGTLTQVLSGNTLKFSGGIDIHSGTLLVNYGENSGKSHGALTLDKTNNTAAFGNSSEVGGKFSFTEIKVVNGGTIRVQFNGSEWNNDLVYDVIALTEGGVSGTGTVVIDFGTTEDPFLASLVFEDVGQGMGAKIISWEEGNSSSATFVAEKSLIEDGGELYAFRAYSGTDGLYVGYVQVPEPGQLAVMLGAAALGFAAWRRRR